ncbi:MAG: type II secretion system protein [Planctomycetota bacterium]
MRWVPAMMARRGFTALEVLVSIGVIGVLITLTLPTLSGSVDSAKRVTCSANLRTLHTGLVLWQDGSDGLLPFATVPADLPRGYDRPFDLLAEVLDTPLAEALDGRFEPSQPWACDSDGELFPKLGVSYRYVPVDFFAAHPDGERSRTEITRLFEPADSAVFVDLAGFHGPGVGGRMAARTAGHVNRLDDRGVLPGVR